MISASFATKQIHIHHIASIDLADTTRRVSRELVPGQADNQIVYRKPGTYLCLIGGYKIYELCFAKTGILCQCNCVINIHLVCPLKIYIIGASQGRSFGPFPKPWLVSGTRLSLQNRQ